MFGPLIYLIFFDFSLDNEEIVECAKRFPYKCLFVKWEGC